MAFPAGRAPRGSGELRRSPLPWPVLVSAAFVLFASAAYNILIFDKAPHIHDEIAYLFQARIFLTGHSTAPLPCVPEAFDFPHMVNVERWHSIYPPGFPLLLAAGLLLGVPWLINPILGAAAVFLFYFLGAEIYDRRTGTLAAILGALSIWLILMSATMMSHTASMVFNAMALLFIFRSLRAPTISNSLLAGLSIGAAFLVRPYNAVFFLAPFLIAWAVRTLREFKMRWKSAAVLIIVAAGLCSLYLLYNASTTGSALKPGYLARYGASFSVVFGRPATQDSDFTPLVSSHQVVRNVQAISQYLFGWPLTSLWPLAFVVWALVRDRKRPWREALLASGVISMAFGFFFFWGAFIFLGARMLFETLPIFVVLSARGLHEAPGLLASRIPRIRVSLWRAILIAVVVGSSCYAFGIRFPRWVAPSWTNWVYDRYDSSMCGSTARIHNAVRSLGLHNSIVVMKMLYAPLPGYPTGWWGSGFSQDTPGLDGDIVYANDAGDASTQKLFQCFPGRSFFYYVGTLEKGVLLPVRSENGTLVTGTPLVPSAPRRRSFELLDWPGRIFALYSPEFTDFIRETVRTEGWRGLDVEGLRSLAIRYRESRDFRRSAFALEAALQIEVNPRVRFLFLGDLIQCYSKLGRSEDAKRIIARIKDIDFKDSATSSLFFIIPTRGF